MFANYIHFHLWLAAIAIGCLASTSVAQRPESSQWRGPAHDGLYPQETTWRTDWATHPPRELWRVPVGIGYSGLAVSQGRAFTVGNVQGEDVIYCLDIESGETVWTARYPQDLVAIYNSGGPNAVPVIDGEWLYIFSKKGLLSCFAKADGELRWRIDLLEKANAKMPTWGFAGAPLVIRDRLFLNANQSGIAVNKNSGAIEWNSPADECGYASAVAMSFREMPALAILGTRELFVVRQEDGQVLWQVPWPTRMGENSADPLPLGDKLYVSSWWDMGAALFQPAAGHEPLWQNKEFQNHIAAPAAFNGYLYGSHGPVHRRTRAVAIACVEIASGKTAWSAPGIKGSLIVADSKLLILTHDGTLIAASASPQGFHELARHEGLGTRTWAPPVLHEGRVYVRDADGFAVCLDLR
jgi:outer membrane protein assembly factor BamB